MHPPTSGQMNSLIKHKRSHFLSARMANHAMPKASARFSDVFVCIFSCLAMHGKQQSLCLRRQDIFTNQTQPAHACPPSHLQSCRLRKWWSGIAKATSRARAQERPCGTSVVDTCLGTLRANNATACPVWRAADSVEGKLNSNTIQSRVSSLAFVSSNTLRRRARAT